MMNDRLPSGKRQHDADCARRASISASSAAIAAASSWCAAERRRSRSSRGIRGCRCWAVGDTRDEMSEERLPGASSPWSHEEKHLDWEEPANSAPSSQGFSKSENPLFFLASWW